MMVCCAQWTAEPGKPDEVADPTTGKFMFRWREHWRTYSYAADAVPAPADRIYRDEQGALIVECFTESAGIDEWERVWRRAHNLVDHARSGLGEPAITPEVVAWLDALDALAL